MAKVTAGFRCPPAERLVVSVFYGQNLGTQLYQGARASVPVPYRTSRPTQQLTQVKLSLHGATHTWYLSCNQNAKCYSEAEGQVDSQETSMSPSAENDLRHRATAKELGEEKDWNYLLCFTSGPVADQCLHLLCLHLHGPPQSTHNSKLSQLLSLVKVSMNHL